MGSLIKFSLFPFCTSGVWLCRIKHLFWTTSKLVHDHRCGKYHANDAQFDNEVYTKRLKGNLHTTTV